MTKAKSKKKATLPYQCLDCGHGADGEWMKTKYGGKACPICGSANTQKLDVSAEIVGEPGMMDAPAAPPGTVPIAPFIDAVPDLPTPKSAPKVPPAKVTAPLMQTIPKTSTSVDVISQGPQEAQFCSLLNDVGIKQAALIARIVTQSDRAEDPKFVDEMLRRYRIPLLQRQIVVDAWSGVIGAEPFVIGEGEHGQGSGGASPMREMMNDMREMFMLQMMSKMMVPEQQQRPAVDPANRPPVDPLIPMTDDDGDPMVDPTTGQVIKVPASLFMIYKGKQTSEKPSTLQEFMGMQQFNLENQKVMMEMFGGNKGPDSEMVAKVAGLEATTQMQIIAAKSQSEIDDLKAQIMAERARQETERMMGQHIGERDKQIRELASELEHMRQSREVSYQETQVDMARKTNDVVMDTMKEATKELRDSRREFRGLLVDNMKNQQFVDAARDRVSGGPVMEVPLEQVERDIANVEAAADDQAWSDVMLGGPKVGIDYELMEPEDREDGGVL